ncbi:hypothetical protein Tco_1027615 [Tanacetum coccineum]
MESNDGAIPCESNLFQEILLKMNLPDHRIKQRWRWRHLVPVESIHHPMLTLNASKPQQDTTRNRGKVIVNSSQPTYDQEPAMVAEDDEMSKEKEIDKLMDNTPRINRGSGHDNQRAVNVAGARENVGTQVVQQSGIQCYNFKEYGPVARECQKLKRVKDVTYHKEKMLLCKQDEAGFQLNVEQAEWRDDTDDEPEDQELEAHYLYENNRGEADQDDDDLARERDFLASLIEKLKCEIDETKDRNKLFESSNKTLVEKLKSEIEDFKNNNKCLESSNNHFKEANIVIAKNNQLMFKDLKKFQAKLDRYHYVNYASKKKEAQIKFYKTREDKEIEKVIALENKVNVLDDIVYKNGQSVQTMNMLNRNCKTSFVKPEFLKKAKRANPRMYDIGCYNDNLALMLAPESAK